MKARIKRNKFSVIVFFIVMFVTLKLGVSPSSLPNYIDSISNILSFSSLTTAIFMAALVFVPRLGKGILHKLGTDKKFLERILVVTFLYFATSVFSLLAIVIWSSESSSWYSVLNLSLIFALLSAGVSESLYIFYVLFETNYS